MKRLLNIVSVALFWLIVYAFVYSNSNVTRQYWVDRNGILVDQFHAPPNVAMSEYWPDVVTVMDCVVAPVFQR